MTLGQYWYVVCPSRSLKHRPREIELLSRNLVLYRCSDGTPVALENRCLHRGMPLAAGRVCGDHLQCPYHGWRYDNAGRVVGIPAAPAQPEDTRQIRITGFGCCERDGYIWVSLQPTPVQTQPPELPYSGAPGWTTFRMYNRFEAPIESCLENFLDCPHATFVHRHWFRSPSNREVRCAVKALDDGAVAEYFDEPRESSLVWSLLSPKKGGMRHTDRFIAPATTRVDYIFSERQHYVITSFCTPVNDELTDVFTVITFRHRVWGPLVRLFFEPLSRRIIAQDVATLKLQHQNLAKYSDRTFCITKQDVLLPHIRRWRQSLANGTTPVGESEAYDVQVVI
ncbi:MAG: aromatic ring-hydroxylating dioxygenase subunit alpha [Pseudomonadota bacterium]|nr:aromatic ring-hydroxylating dioxygenase subunit alpha [Pseudomonadota bacterium]